MREETLTALADRLDCYDTVVEIGIGRTPALAGELASRGMSVTATDIVHRETPRDVRFIRDDVTAPTVSIYEGAGAVVALNLPPELHAPTARLADRIDANFLFTTLGGDPPTVPVSREMVPGTTLYVYERGRRTDPQRP